MTNPDLGEFPDRAVYSPDGKYRYEFQRRWAETADPSLDTVVWLLLNPGTGDRDGTPRRTLDRCISWSKSWGYASLTIVNLFAYRTTDPKLLRSAVDVIGPENDAVIRRVTEHASRVVVAWGNHGSLLGRGAQVAGLLRDPLCLSVTKKGQPRHPLYVRTYVDLQPYRRV